MTFSAIKDGFTRARAVLYFLRTYPILLTYMLIIEFYHVCVISFLPDSFLFLDIISSLLLVGLGIALVHHSSHILQRKQIAMVNSLREAGTKFKDIAIWGGVGALIKLTGTYMVSFFGSLVSQELLAIIGIITWSLIISCIIAIIAYDNLSPITTLQRAFSIIRTFPLQIVGGYGFLSSFFLIPIIPLFLIILLPIDTSMRFLDILNSTLVMFTIRLIVACITIIVRSALILFCSSLYREQQRHTLEELIIDARMTWLNS